MRSYNDFSINTKLTLLVLLAGGVALSLATICFVLNDISMIRSSMVKQMSALADVLGANSTAALKFDDAQTATELLKSLRQQPAVEFACIYDATGKPFAMYHHKDDNFKPPAAPTRIGSQFEGGKLNVTQRIREGGELIGKIYLRASMDELRNQIIRYVAIVVVMMIVSWGSSVLLSSRFQRGISTPILRLAEAAERISIDGNYGIRVTKTSNDELGALYDQFNAMLDQIQKGEAAIQQAHDELEIKIQIRTAELSLANKDLSREVSERLRAEKELESAHQKLMDAARRAGMAEIATGVLHNVGNVLNSINVSATLVSDRMRQSKVADLVRATKLIEQHAQDLGAFMTTDPKGKQLPAFLSLLSTHLSDERADVVNELEQMTTKVSHVKAIISTQQTYAGVSGVIEAVDLATTLDDAMKLNIASFERHKIAIIREYEPMPVIELDKQKVLQILVNLIKNAKEAFQDCPLENRKLIVRTNRSDEDTLQIQIIDNGMGIPAEDLTRVFSHGFTTKAAGHGFGLHSCANAANELGGSLVALSDGPGKGATFILQLPFIPISVPVKAS